MIISYLGLGSNLGDRFGCLLEAVERLNSESGITVANVSPVYETAPVGGIEQPDYFNAAAEIETVLEPEKLLGTCLAIEHDMGRVRAEKWGPRVIDIDILFYGDIIIESADLTVPHPSLDSRAFVLCPLSDIAPDLVHPASGKTVNDLRIAAGDAGIRKISNLKLF
ncbi:2-amino-4-hydroxy-6-hydroxymethyldihydropteridine diphosphokinase [Candidatus Latescibacterota bacterium]